MNWLAFVASLFASLIWPALVLVLLLMFREQFRDLLSRPLSKVTAGTSGVSFEWEAAESQVKKAIATKSGSDSETATTLEVPKNGRPSFAQKLVEQSWSSVEETLRDRVKKVVGPEEEKKLDFPELLKAARMSFVCDESTVQALDGLHKMWKLAATGEISVQRAREYEILADAVAYSLQEQEPKGPAPRGWV